MKTLQTQYNLIKEGKGHKDVFLKEAKSMFPSEIRHVANFEEASTALKSKGVISEHYVDLKPINKMEPTPKQGFETSFASFIAEEAKAVEKKVSKEVEEDASHAYDTEDKDVQDNLIFDQFQNGVYFEAKQAPEKDLEDIKDIVRKNLAKDPIYYTKNGMFGVEAGYTEDAVALVPKEIKQNANSGYGEPTKKDFPKGEVGTGYLELKENKMISLLDLINENEEDKAPKKARKAKKPTLDSKLAEIEKAGKIVTMEAQMDSVDEAIEAKNERLSMVSEDENLSELVDKKKMKEMQKEIKLLEKKRATMEKMYEKMCGKSYTKKEMVDEMDSASFDRQNGTSMDADPKTVGQSIPNSNF